MARGVGRQTPNQGKGVTVSNAEKLPAPDPPKGFHGYNP
jgi:hypothetical protein